MQRLIKFRAWDYTSNVMRNDITEMVFNSDGTLNQIDVETGADILFPEKECVLMQYTGLKDKNGVEIYEGDILGYDFNIVSNESREIKNFKGCSVVKFGEFNPEDEYEDRASYGWLWASAPLTKHSLNCGYSNPYWELKDGEPNPVVIGNIYENPELLEANQ